MDISFDIYAFAQASGEVLDGVGVVIILAGVVIATAILVDGLFKKERSSSLYPMYRRNLGRAVLLGLEFLVAGDVIRTVAGNPTFDSVIVLAVIVLIRTFLAFEFEMEIDGRWPWQRKKAQG